MASGSPSTPRFDKYRPDIDGLRAVAVMAVVLFHSGVRSLSGGYVGVDVFFVISGYLITAYIDQRIAAGRFSILEFYERRVRRILPALFFFLLCALILGYLVLLPGDLISFAKSAIATLFFVPNVLFHYQAGYFDIGAKLKPLLHTWSLGVEEQFYILFPPFVLLASRQGRRSTIASIWLAFIGSLALSVWGVQYHRATDAAFYLVPFRAWELLLGALLALKAFPVTKSPIARELLAAAGLLAIVVSAFAYSPATPFPGLTATLPCLGTALEIYANESGPTLVGRVLSLKPIVGIGLVSYSLYLWHWPIIVFARQFRNRPLTATESTLCVLFSLAASVLSWKFVEQPFRRGPARVPRGKLFLRAAAVAACLTVLAGACVATRGFRQRFAQQAMMYADDAADPGRIPNLCYSPKQVEDRTQCHLGLKQGGAPAFLLWGDSHAASLAPAFDLTGKDKGETGWIAFRPACLPLRGVERPGFMRCNEFNESVLKMIERWNIPTVILAGRWSVAAIGLSAGELEEGRPQATYTDLLNNTGRLEASSQLLQRSLRRLLSDPVLQNRKVFLVLDIPDTGVNTPRHLAWSVIHRTVLSYPQNIDIPMSSYSKQSLLVDDLLIRLAAEYHVTIIDPKTELCKGSECLIARDGHSLYRDSHHLTTFGASKLENLFAAVMPAATETPKPRSR